MKFGKCSACGIWRATTVVKVGPANVRVVRTHSARSLVLGQSKVTRGKTAKPTVCPGSREHAKTLRAL